MWVNWWYGGQKTQNFTKNKFKGSTAHIAVTISNNNALYTGKLLKVDFLWFY
jgi:hypothetical protein